MSSIDYFGLSAIERKGYLFPDAYLEEVSKKFKPNVYGCVVVNKENNGLDILHAFDKDVEFSKIRAFSKALSKKMPMWFFGNYPKDYIADSIQPFMMLLNDDLKDQVAITLCGDFKAHEEKEAKHSPQWWCAHKKIMPKLQMMWRLTKGDVNTFIEELKSTQLQNEMKEYIGPQGGMIQLYVFHKEEPQIISYGKSMPTYKDFPWGSTTDVLGYVTGMAEPAKGVLGEQATVVAQPKKKNTFDDLLDGLEDDDEEVKVEDKAKQPVISAQTVANKPTETTKIVKEKEIVDKDGTIIRLTEVDGKQVVLLYHPIGITKTRGIKRFWQGKIGRDVSNKEAETNAGIMPPNKDLAKYLKMFDPTFHSLKDAAEHLKSTTGVTEKVVGKDVATGADVVKVISDTMDNLKGQGKEYPEGGSPIYSVLSKKAQYDINKYLKTLDKGGQAVIPPIIGQELEETTDQFYKLINYPGLEATFGWSPEVRYNIAKNHPEAMVIWTGDLLRLIANQSKELVALAHDPAIEDDDEDVGAAFQAKKTA